MKSKIKFILKLVFVVYTSCYILACLPQLSMASLTQNVIGFLIIGFIAWKLLIGKKLRKSAKR